MLSPFFLNLAFLTISVSLTVAVCLIIYERRASNLKAAIKAARTENRELWRQLDYDPLTMCHSRRFFVTECQRLLDEPNSKGLTLLIMDIDYFKSINDSYGHAAGDAFLIAAADALKAYMGDDAIVARLGGDEFWIAREAIPPAQAQDLAEALGGVIRKIETHQHGTKVTRSASIGVSTARAGTPLNEAMLEADTALYLAKSGGRNLALQADLPVLEVLNSKRTRPTIEGIRQGLADDQFTYFVQPIFDISVPQPHPALGVEALIRWIRPDGSILLPADFMTTITRHYNASVKPPLHLANQVASRFAYTDPAMFCAFNVSSAFLQRSVGTGDNWLDDLLAGLPPERTVFEIVESAVIEDSSAAKSLLTAVRAAGVRIALDDFGTGHSNLMRLRDLPVDIVKIDRSFVGTITNSRTNTAILKALIGMGQDLDFDIIAEGVETPDQLHKLQDMGITQAQGFYLGEPGSLDDWSTRLSLPTPHPKASTSAAVISLGRKPKQKLAAE